MNPESILKIVEDHISNGDMQCALSEANSFFHKYIGSGNCTKSEEAFAYSLLARVYIAKGDYSHSYDAFLTAYQIYTEFPQCSGEHAYASKGGMAESLLKLGRYEESRKLLIDVIDYYSGLQSYKEQAYYLIELSIVYKMLLDDKKRESAAQQAVNLYDLNAQTSDYTYAIALDHLIRSKLYLNQYSDAKILCIRGLDILAQLGKTNTDTFANLKMHLGECEYRLGNMSVALEHLHSAENCYESISGLPLDYFASLYGRFATYYLIDGGSEKAVAYLAKALAIYTDMGLKQQAESVRARIAGLDD